MDSILKAILDRLGQEAITVGSDLIRDGVELVKARLTGEATDQQILDWLREAQS